MVEKIKGKKGDFALILVGRVHKLMARHCKDKRTYLNITTTLSTDAPITRTKSIRPYIVGLTIGF